MELLHTIDKNNYKLCWPRSCRDAVRAIILNNNKLAMVRSSTNGYYKFPGGGVVSGESQLDTLIRETLEETGLHIIASSVKEFGLIREIRRSQYAEEIFDHNSFYYTSEVTEEISPQRLDAYEIALGFELHWVDIETAYKTNLRLSKNYESTHLIREAYIMGLLLNKLPNQTNL